MSARVSIVVAVYNPGEYLEPLIDSILGQTMPAGEYEVIFVNDGSTDGSGARLDALAAEHAHIHVRHIPNSGWPGRPRNVGLDMASGEYVYIVDHDDWLAPEALDRLCERADRNDADVVVGKEVGHGFGVPLEIFERDVDDARLGEAPLMNLLTPHKMFRRSMLTEHGIRFPEGRRRLEDHAFVVHAYFHARRISILADYACYHWTERRGKANATHNPVDPVVYYDSMRDILDMVDRHTEPGPLRDRLYAHWYWAKTLHKLRGARWYRSDRPAANALGQFSEIRRISAERFGPRLDGLVRARYRLTARAVETGDERLLALQAEANDGLRGEVEITSRESRDWYQELSLACTLVDRNGEPFRFTRRGERWFWSPPEPIASHPAIRDAPLDVTDELPQSKVTVVVRHRQSGVQYERPIGLKLETHGDTALSKGSIDVALDLATFACGNALSDGIWDVSLMLDVCGWRARTVLPAQVAITDPAERATRAYRTQAGTLVIRVKDSPSPPIVAPPPLPPAAEIAVARPTPSALRRRLRQVVPHSARRMARDVVGRLTGRSPGS